MNVREILYILGKMCACLAVVLLVPLLMALYYGEYDGMKAFALTVGISCVLSFLLQHGSRVGSVRSVSLREGIGTVFFAWILSAVLSGLPYLFIGALDPVSAFFESMSGLTTTGATSIPDLDIIPKSVLFWRSFTHWIGGIGIVVLFVAVLPQMAGNAVYLFNAEVSGFFSSRIMPRIRSTAVALFYIYLLMTIILVGILAGLGMSEYDAVNHAFSAVATGGFSTYNNSVAHFQSPAIEFFLGVFMILGGGNFALYYHMTQVGVKVLWHDVEFRSYIIILAVLTLLITLNIVWVNGFSLREGLRHAFFQVASFGSTTGYISYDYDTWPAFSKLLLAVTYLVGGCAGSTAGGIKVSRFVVLIKTIAAELRCIMHPSMLLTVYYGGKRLPIPTILNISRFFFMYIMIIAVLAIFVTAGGLPAEEAVFGVAACISSVGPAFGEIGATGNFSQVSDLGKIAFSLAMLLGRLELFTALVLLRREFWYSNKHW